MFLESTTKESFQRGTLKDILELQKPWILHLLPKSVFLWASSEPQKTLFIFISLFHLKHLLTFKTASGWNTCKTAGLALKIKYFKPCIHLVLLIFHISPYRICLRRWCPITAWGGSGLSGIKKGRSTWLPPSEPLWPSSTPSPTASSPPAWATRRWSPTREPGCWRGG